MHLQLNGSIAAMDDNMDDLTSLITKIKEQ